MIVQMATQTTQKPIVKAAATGLLAGRSLNLNGTS